jgi:hypothetical protein
LIPERSFLYSFWKNDLISKEEKPMKKWLILLGMLVMAAVLMGSATKDKFHEEPLPDPKSFNAHYDDMDRNGDEMVNYEEFKAYFPHGNESVFKALDLNKDGSVDHDEWHKFKEAHGLKNKD